MKAEDDDAELSLLNKPVLGDEAQRVLPQWLAGMVGGLAEILMEMLFFFMFTGPSSEHDEQIPRLSSLY